MTLINCNQTPSERKALLKGQILQARSVKDERRMSLLQSRWIHRYGFDTFPVKNDINELNNHYGSIDLTISKNEGKSITLESNRYSPIDNSTNENQTTSWEIDSKSVLKENDLQELAEARLKVDDKSSEVVDQSDQELFGEAEKLDSGLSQLPPPPLPQLNHLRKWFSLSEDDLPKAS